jgi:hypothetical protein
VHAENEGITVLEAGAARRLAWGAEAHLRGHTASAFAVRVGACPAFALESWHPESGRATGVSEFPVAGRAMVLLRRMQNVRAR